MEKFITKILSTLEKNGYEAYLVGGFVRDTLLGIKSKDVDICTNALPKEMHTLFNSTKNNYGSINLKSNNYNIDITTYRKDFDYVNRHPSKVEYINSLEEDLNRRDFTINAICMDKTGKIVDLLNGVEDLNNRVIKMIGDPGSKLIEDPLRILRAIRFSTILDFTIDEDLYVAIKENANLVTTLSGDRIKCELEKMLLSKNFLKGLRLLDELGISSLINLEYENVVYVDDLIGMFSQIKVDNIPFTNNEKKSIIDITEALRNGLVDNMMLYKYGLYISTIVGKILNINPKEVNKIYKKMPIKSQSDIAITSKEIIDILGTGKIVSDTYKKLTEEILNGNLKNNNKVIKEYLKKGSDKNV